jgi:hypothetical protein
MLPGIEAAIFQLVATEYPIWQYKMLKYYNIYVNIQL